MNEYAQETVWPGNAILRLRKSLKSLESISQAVHLQDGFCYESHFLSDGASLTPKIEKRIRRSGEIEDFQLSALPIFLLLMGYPERTYDQTLSFLVGRLCQKGR